MNFQVHASSFCASEKIGAGTRIWAFVNILAGAEIGENCNICDHVFIENDVKIGNRVTIKTGVSVWDGVTLEDDVFVGPNVSFTNDRYPQSGNSAFNLQRTLVKSGASIGAGSVILPGLEIGSQSIIGAGTIVTESVPPDVVVIGNPGRVIRNLR
jgi:acetyltransferase-like isoleucine patch superfamily enzyme